MNESRAEEQHLIAGNILQAGKIIYFSFYLEPNKL